MPTFAPGYNGKIYHGAYDLSPFFHDSSPSRTVQMLPNTTYGQTSVTRQSGLHNGALKASGYYDGAVGAVDEAFQGALGGADQVLTYGPVGDARGSRALLGALQETKYDTKLAVGALVATDGEWVCQGGAFIALGAGVWLLAKTVLAASADTTGHDGGAATTTGWRATLHCFAKSGTSPTLDAKLQDSADNVTFADVTGGTFAQVTAVGAQILHGATGATLRRYTRIHYVLGGSSGPTITAAAAVARQ